MAEVALDIGYYFARYGALPIGLAVVGGLGAWWYDEQIAKHPWIGVVIGISAGFGVGALFVMG